MSPGATTAPRFEWDCGDGEPEAVEIVERIDGPLSAVSDGPVYWIATTTPWDGSYNIARPDHLFILPNAPERSAS